MTVSNAQVRKLMEEASKHGQVGLAALRAGVDRKTAAKYLKEGKYPSELRKERTWRTRQDPFEQDWPEIAARLVDAPELEAKALFEHLLAEVDGRYESGQLRTVAGSHDPRRSGEGRVAAPSDPTLSGASRSAAT